MNKILEDDGTESLEPIPIRKWKGMIVATDGHTRLMAHFLKGRGNIRTVWDTDDLDWALYEVCVNWCRDNNIRSVKDLKGRIIDDEAYKTLWIDRCQQEKKRLRLQEKIQ